METAQFIYDMAPEQNPDLGKKFLDALTQPTDAKARSALIALFAEKGNEKYKVEEADIDDMVNNRAKYAAMMPRPMY
jgi:hypothetical protein